LLGSPDQNPLDGPDFLYGREGDDWIEGGAGDDVDDRLGYLLPRCYIPRATLFEQAA
jgi:hypothetical protein